MTIALWSQLIIAFTLLMGVCVFARRQASVTSSDQAARQTNVIRLAA